MAARRFLAAQARSGNGHGYLSQPPRPFPQHNDPVELAREAERVAARTCTCDEPESESGAWLNATADRAFMLNQQARIADITHAQSMRPQLSLEQRMMDARRRARMQHIDIRSEFTAVKRMLDSAKTENERRSAKTVAAAERRLTRIEIRLDQLPGEMAA